MPVGAQFLVIVQMHGLEHPVVIDVLVAALLNALAHKVKQQFVNFGRYTKYRMILTVIILYLFDKTFVTVLERVTHGLTLGREVVLPQIDHGDIGFKVTRLPFGLACVVKSAGVALRHIPARLAVAVIIITRNAFARMRHRNEIGIKIPGQQSTVCLGSVLGLGSVSVARHTVLNAVSAGV